jgi:peptide/nickel transport system ATP-binding protein
MTGPISTSILEVEGLNVVIRQRHSSTVHAVTDVSLRVGEGETLGIVGESGSGKTMTGLSIMQLLPNGGEIASGRITLCGTAISELDNEQMRSVRGRDVGMIFQDPLSSLNPTMPIGIQIAEPIRLHVNKNRKLARKQALEMLSLVGFPDPKTHFNLFPHQLSGGMRQRVMIAIALSCNPKLLIADEPTTGLDVTIQRQILELIDDLKAKLGMAVVLITHDLGVIAGHADRVAVMYAGKIVEEDVVQSLFYQARHPYTAALFAALPQTASERGRRLLTIRGMPPDLSQTITGCRFAPRCSRAAAQCRNSEPPLTAAGQMSQVACYFPIEWTHNVGVVEVSATPTDPSLGSNAVAIRETEAGSGEPSLQPGSSALLRFDAVSKEYREHGGLFANGSTKVSAVSDVSFEIGSRETLGLVGESGCGKSTIGRMAVAIERPTSGAITFDGQNLESTKGNALRSIRGQLHLVFQDPAAALDPRRTVQSSVAEPLAIQHEGNRLSRQRRVLEVLNDVGLPPTAADRYPHEFSGGQRQRIAFARSLASLPRLIVADEPVSALDVSVQAQVLNLMVDLQEKYELAYLLISHNLAVVRYLATRIAVMYLGEIVEIGPSEIVCTAPIHPYTRALIDSIPITDPVAERDRKRATIIGEIPSSREPPSGCRFRTRCPRAQDICTFEKPLMRTFGHPDHLAACHFPMVESMPPNSSQISIRQKVDIRAKRIYS